MTARQAAAGRQRGASEADENAALAELERARADGGYHGFCVLEHRLWSAISKAGEVFTGNTPDGLDPADPGALASTAMSAGRCSR